jgi:hypothetical protein
VRVARSVLANGYEWGCGLHGRCRCLEGSKGGLLTKCSKTCGARPTLSGGGREGALACDEASEQVSWCEEYDG